MLTCSVNRFSPRVFVHILSDLMGCSQSVSSCRVDKWACDVTVPSVSGSFDIVLLGVGRGTCLRR